MQFNYRVHTSLRDPYTLEEELADLGKDGWEVITILEQTLPGTSSYAPTWVIVSKKPVVA